MKLIPDRPVLVSLRLLLLETATEPTGELLHHLQAGAEDGAADVAVALGEGPGKAGDPGTEPGGLGNHLHLKLMVGHDLGELILDVGGLDRLAANVRQGTRSGIQVALLDEVAG